MAYEVFVQAFEAGIPVLMRSEVVEPIVAPFIIERSAEFAQVKTSDGGADLYGYGDDGGLLVANPSGGEIWELVLSIARVNGAAIIPIGEPAIVVDEEIRKELPEDMRDTARVVRARRALMDALGF